MKVIIKETNGTPTYKSLHVTTPTCKLESALFSSNKELYNQLEEGVELYDEIELELFFEQVTDMTGLKSTATITLDSGTGDYKLKYIK